MKDKKEDHVFGVEEQMEIETFTSEFQLQKDRIRNILDEAIYKLRLLVSP
jgi:DNA-directed RNA polymerase sigma subunit (sigma70/sigma32)